MIEGTDADLLCAGLLMRGLGTVFPRRGEPRYGLDSSFDLVKLVRVKATENQESSDRTGSKTYSIPLALGKRGKADQDATKQQSTVFAGQKLYTGQSPFGFGFLVADHRYFKTRIQSSIFQRLFRPSTIPGQLSIQRPYNVFTAGDVLRFSSAQQCYEKYPSILTFGLFNNDNPPSPWYTSFLAHRSQNMVCTAERTIGTGDGTESFDLALFFAGLAYGGLHLIAWNPPVRTTAEALMWRISGIAVILYRPLPGIIRFCFPEGKDGLHRIAVFLRNHRPSWWWKSSWIGCALEDIAIGMTVLVGLPGTALYVLSRIYLVVECFISIPRLPASVFETPVWSQYVPHLS